MTLREDQDDGAHWPCGYSRRIGMPQCHSACSSSRLPVFVITPTYERAVKSDGQPRDCHLARVAHAIDESGAVACWIVVEDAAQPSTSVQTVLRKYPGVKSVHFAHGPTRQFGNAQRGAGLQHVLDSEGPGMVVFADDDNLYDARYFDLIATAGAAAHSRGQDMLALAVGCLGPWRIERPYHISGRVVGWDASWIERRFPLDTAGFAVHTRALRDVPLFEATNPLTTALEAELAAATENGDSEETRHQLRARLERARRGQRYPDPAFGGETEFIETLVAPSGQPLSMSSISAACDDVLVFHDPPLHARAEELRSCVASRIRCCRYKCMCCLLGAYQVVQPFVLVCLLACVFVLGPPPLSGGTYTVASFFVLALEWERGVFRNSSCDLLLPSHALNGGAALAINLRHPFHAPCSPTSSCRMCWVYRAVERTVKMMREMRVAVVQSPFCLNCI